MTKVWLVWLVFLLMVLFALPARGAGDPLEEPKALTHQAVELFQAGRYQEALPLQQRALEI